MLMQTVWEYEVYIWIWRCGGFLLSTIREFGCSANKIPEIRAYIYFANVFEFNFSGSIVCKSGNLYCVAVRELPILYFIVSLVAVLSRRNKKKTK